MNWKRSLLAAAAVIPVVGLFYYGMGQNPKEIPSPLPGRAAPAFALNAMGTADTVRLDALRGQVVVLNFWASWCVACRSEHDVLRQAASRYGPLGVQFYGVLYNDTPENGAGYIAEMGGQNYPTLLDPKTRTAIDYGLYGVPETFIIGPDGRVLHKQVGPVTPATFAKFLDPLLMPKAAAQ